MRQVMSEVESYKLLAASIIQQAVMDKRLAPDQIRRHDNWSKRLIERINQKDIDQTEVNKLKGYIADAESRKRAAIRVEMEVEAFVQSDWFEWIAEFLGMNADYLRRKIKAV